MRAMKPTFFQHPSALVESTAVGTGTRIWAFAHVLRGARIGAHCNIGDHSFVEGGARIGDNVTIKNGVALWEGVVVRDNAFVGPFAVFTNDLAPRSPRFPGAARRYASRGWLSRTVVEEGASIGANATILCGLRIGRFAMIGAGAVVTRTVPAYALMIGVPARRIGWVCECGARLPEDSRTTMSCPACNLRYEARRGRLLRGQVRNLRIASKQSSQCGSAGWENEPAKRSGAL
jgi:UDP-2-acetamido-3-amino-2,3-dideoxy-glucuronate N-acetyltransferase